MADSDQLVLLGKNKENAMNRLPVVHLIVLTVALLLPVGACATTRYVSPAGSNLQPFTNLVTAANSIQSAIDASADGDVILVDAGTYVLESTLQIDRAVTIKSTSGARYTVIDGDYPRLAIPCVRITSKDALLDGLTIRNGTAGMLWHAGEGGTPLRNLVVVYNAGNGMEFRHGGGAQNCTIAYNTGPGMYIYDHGGGSQNWLNNILWSNSIPWVSVLCGQVPSDHWYTNDPSFYSETDFRLRPESPCIDTGANVAWMNDAFDANGLPRIHNGTVDIGAYEDAPEAHTTTRYVSPDGSHVAPFTSWITAATNIQPCLDACVTGDTVEVGPGIYRGAGNIDLDFLGKDIRLYSSAGAEQTIIDVEDLGNHRAFFFHSGESSNATVTGFTLLDGHGNYDYSGGGAVNCRGGATPVFNSCIFTSNYSWTHGGAITVAEAGSEIRVVDSVFVQNYARWEGSCIGVLNGAHAIIENCLFHGSTGNPAIEFYNESSGEIVSSTLAYNAEEAISLEVNSSARIMNTILWGNNSGGAQIQNPDNLETLSYSCIQNLVELGNNIAVDPHFADPAAEDYTLSLSSPCIDVGTNLPWMVGATDLKGDERILNGTVDMGAYEFAQTASSNRILVLDGSGDWLEIDRAVEQSFTIEAWIRPDAAGTTDEPWYINTAIVDNTWDHGTRDYGLILRGVYPGVGIENILVVTSGVTVTIGQWVHVAVTRDATSGLCKVYLQGGEVGSGIGTTLPLDTEPKTWIGYGHWNAHNGRSDYFSGAMDELRFWSRVLSPGEIISNMCTTLTGTEPGLVTYLNFDAGDFSDLTGSGNDATVHGDPLVVEETIPCGLDDDPDMDGLSTGQEAFWGTNPVDPDSDDDGLYDGLEVSMANGSGCPDPLDDDSDDDGVLDGDEVLAETDPCALGPFVNPANGHYYEYVTLAVSWEEAVIMAADRTFDGKQGYLTTITSETENGFLVSNLFRRGMLGGSDADVESDWRWMDGPEAGFLFFRGEYPAPSRETFIYADWGDNEPNDYDGTVHGFPYPGEDYLEFATRAGGEWNDVPGSPYLSPGFFVEYGDSTGFPEVVLQIVSPHGSPVPGVGIYTNEWGAALTNSVPTPATQGSTQYVCTGWTLTGQEPASGATNSMTMVHTNDATLTWQWKTQYWLDTEAGPHGSVSPVDAWHDGSAVVPVTATPESNYHFAGWTGTGVDAGKVADPGAAVTTVAVDGGYTLQANFVEAPQIISEPQSRSVVEGSSLMFSVTTTGSTLVVYQWLKDEVVIDGAIDRTLVVAYVTTTDADNYSVAVSSPYGSVTSATAVLTVETAVPPNVIGGPVTNPASGHVYFLLDQSTWVEAEMASVAMGGHLATIRSAAEQEFVYSSFSNWAGQARNLCIGLYDADPYINATNWMDRQSEFVWASGEAVGYANWIATEPNNWREYGEFWVHIFDPRHAPAAGYWNDVWDTDENTIGGWTAPLNGVVEIVPPLPVLLEIVSDHGTAAPGVGSYTNDWGSALTNSVSSPDTQGTTQYVCTGWVMSGQEPSSGTTNIMTMTHTNNAVLTWQWETRFWLDTDPGTHGSVSPPDGWYDEGAVVAVDATPDANYYFSGWTGTAVDAGKVANSNDPSTTVTIDDGYTLQANFVVASQIATPPQPRTIVLGASLMFSVTATGEEPLGYQWQKDGVAIGGAIDRTLVVAYAAYEDAGNYSVIVSGPGGTVTSSNALLTVESAVPPRVIGNPVTNDANGHVYYLLEQSTWIEANLTAESLGGHLATIRNAAEQEFVFTNFSNWAGQPHNLWIGLHDADPYINSTNWMDRQSEFVWASGEPVTYSNWKDPEPNNWLELGEFWVQMFDPRYLPAAGQWNDVFDTDEHTLGLHTAPLHGVLEIVPPPPRDIALKIGPALYYARESSERSIYRLIGRDTPFTNVWHYVYGPLHGTGDILYGFERGTNLVFLPARAWEITADADGSSLLFDGMNDFAYTGHDDALDLAGGITMEAWVKPAPGGSEGTIMAKALSGSVSCYKLGVDSANRFRFRLSDSGGTDFVDLSSAAAVPDTQWSHIAATYNGATATLYVNGYPDTNTPATGSVRVSAISPFGIGSIFGSDPFSGLIDEVRLWNYARTSSEILQNYNVKLGDTPAGLAAYWQLSETNGQVAADSGPDGLHLTLGDTGSADSADPTWYPESFPGHSAYEMIWEFGQPCISVYWDSLPGGYYQIQTNEQLGTDAWGGLGGLLNGSGETLEYFEIPEVPSRDFRLEFDESSVFLPAPTGMVLIPGGEFEMGDSMGDIGGGEHPVHTVYVSPFYMDRYEVTKALWDEVHTWAVTNGYGFTLPGYGKGPDHPVHTPDWYDNVKWCNARSEKEGLDVVYFIDSAHTSVYRTGVIDLTNDDVDWDGNGYRLPTEAEWEKAARGGLNGRRFPWGDTISYDWANYAVSPDWPYDYDLSCCGPHPLYGTAPSPYTSPVGSFPPNGYGLYDMCGNIDERCWDWYSSGYYAVSPASDPRGPASIGDSRVMRGGEWHSTALWVRCSFRGAHGQPTRSGYTYGFRCVRRP